MVGKTKQATLEQEHRMESIKEFCGCLPCLIEGMLDSHCDVHHVLSAGRRIGHDATYGNCIWHHRGIEWENKRPREMVEMLGPSMARNIRAYRDLYGTEERLVMTQNYMLHLLNQNPWGSFETPISVATQVKNYWTEYPTKRAA